MLREHAAVTTPRPGRSLCLPPYRPPSRCRHRPRGCLPARGGRGPGLLERLAILPALRARRGRRHTLASVLALSATAVLAGGRSVAGIAEWAADAPGSVLPALGVSCEPSRPNLGCACLALPRLMTRPVAASLIPPARIPRRCPSRRRCRASRARSGPDGAPLVQGLDGEHRARGSDGVPQRDRSADGVHLLVGHLELPLHREGDRGVRLVRLDDVDVIDVSPAFSSALSDAGTMPMPM